MASTTNDKTKSAETKPDATKSKLGLSFPTSEELARKKREDNAEKSEEARTFTYIGAGEDSPRSINFMGKQQFTRGKSVNISDPELIGKLIGNPTFVEGEADQDLLDMIDEEAKLDADKQRKDDARTQAAFAKKYRTEG